VAAADEDFTFAQERHPADRHDLRARSKPVGRNVTIVATLVVLCVVLLVALVVVLRTQG
jgi:broad-specificity NMP kinase